MTATKTFVNFEADLQSFELANEQYLGVLEPGVIRGFDVLVVPTPGLNFTIQHVLTGIRKVAKDGVTESQQTGVLYTRQGTVAHFEDIIGPLAIPNNGAGEEEAIHVVYFQHKYQVSASPTMGTIGIITGVAGEGEPDIPSPTEQLKIGIIRMPAGASGVLPEYWERARIKSIGGVDNARLEELEELAADVVFKTTDQEIFDKKTFKGDLEVANPENSLEIFNVGKRLNTKFQGEFEPGADFSNSYIEILRIENYSGIIKMNGIVTVRSTGTGQGSSYMKFSFAQRDYGHDGEIYLDLLEVGIGDKNVKWGLEHIIAYNYTDIDENTYTGIVVKIPVNATRVYNVDILHYEGDDNVKIDMGIRVLSYISLANQYAPINRSYPLELSKTVNIVNDDNYFLFKPGDAPNDTQETAKTRWYALPLVDGVRFYEIYANSPSTSLVKALFGGIDASKIKNLYPGFTIKVKVNGKWVNDANSRGDSLGTNRVLGVGYSAITLRDADIQYCAGYSSSNTRNMKMAPIENIASAADPYRKSTKIPNESNFGDYAGYFATAQDFRGSSAEILTSTVGDNVTLPSDPLQSGDNLVREYDAYVYMEIMWDGSTWQEIKRTIGSPSIY